MFSDRESNVAVSRVKEKKKNKMEGCVFIETRQVKMRGYLKDRR